MASFGLRPYFSRNEMSTVAEMSSRGFPIPRSIPSRTSAIVKRITCESRDKETVTDKMRLYNYQTIQISFLTSLVLYEHIIINITFSFFDKTPHTAFFTTQAGVRDKKIINFPSRVYRLLKQKAGPSHVLAIFS
uniref:Uncharacterized protein n=1 Tax=Cacopsylla melanoneura TaxID=428564 RepID=A0A8D9EYH5_9HEMI